MMQHRFKLYAATQPLLMKFVPADVRHFTAYVFHCLVHLFSDLTLLVLAPFLYLLERRRSNQVTLPPYNHLIITGASSGVGEGLAYAYSKPGVRIVLIARDAEQLALVAKKCQSLGAEAVVAVMDVKDQAGMERVIKEAEAVKPIDIAFAVAGHESAMGGKEDIVGSSRETIQVNVIGMLNTILPCIPYMRQRRRGQLVLFSSQLGFIAAPLAADYDSAKVCIRLYGEGLRSLLHSSNIAVNVIVPGGMETPMMNTLTERAELPTVPFILPVPNAILFMQEGVKRNVGVIAFPSVMTAFNSAVGGWPAGVRDLFLASVTTEHHKKWRLGEIEDYKKQKGGQKPDDYYKKEREAETDRQRGQKQGTRKEL